MAFKRILLRRDTSSNWTSGNAVLSSGEIGYETNTGKFKIGNGSTAWTSLAYSITTNLAASVLNDLGDVTITSAADGDFLRWNGTAWINDAVNLSTDTIGSYVQSLVAGTGVTLSGNSGENATPTVNVDTTVIQARVADVSDTEIGYLNGVTSAIQTQIDLKAPLASPTFSGTVTLPSGTVTSAMIADGTIVNADISSSAAIADSKLATISTANKVSNSATTATDANTASAIVARDASGNFTAGTITAALTGNASTATTLATARNIAGQSFDGSANISIAPTDLTGVTSTAAEINILDGATLSVTELNYVDGVTSAIQTQLDAKAPLASPTFTGTVVLPDNTVALGTKTTGDYVASLVAGTGVTLSNNSGETATPTIAIGQAVATNSNVTFNDLTVSGNLTVSGTTTSINTETLTVDDNIIVLNNNATGAPSANAGIEIERGSSTNVVLRWNETDDAWELTNDGSTYSQIATASSVSSATALTVDNLTDVVITSAANKDFLMYNGTNWVDQAITLGTDTTGDYVATLTAGTGITLANNSGEGSSPTVTVDTTVIQAKVANVTDTEIGYLDGVTSAIQTQMDLKAPLASPTFTGTPTLPTGTIATTQAAADSTTAVATTAFVTTADNLKANLASPTFTGTPAAPTATAGTSTTQVATTAFVFSSVDNDQFVLAGQVF